MAFWEYAAVTGLIDSKGSTHQYLDNMGAQGWELISVTPTGYGIFEDVPISPRNEQFGIYYFKRPAPPQGLIAISIDIVRSALVWGRQLQRSPAPDRMPDLPEVDTSRSAAPR
jgi:hypothetical protein